MNFFSNRDQLEPWLPPTGTGFAPTAFGTALVLLNYCSQYSREVGSAALLPRLFRDLNCVCARSVFAARMLVQECESILAWYRTESRLPVLLELESQQVSHNGRPSWTSTDCSLWLTLGKTMDLRALIWNVHPRDVHWWLNDEAVPAMPAACPRHNLLKSQCTIRWPGSYKCTTTLNGRHVQLFTFEVCCCVFRMQKRGQK